MTDTKPIIVEEDRGGVVRVNFNRPQKGNAYTGEMLEQMEQLLDTLFAQGGTRLMLVTGNGRHFQAGADLDWVNEVSRGTPESIHEVSLLTTRVLHKLNTAPFPTIALINGACFGGGVGIAASCDTAIAASTASFAISEVLYGQAPLPIVPQLNSVIGHRNARRYALTGERFDVNTAKDIGLVHEIVAPDQLRNRGHEIMDAYLRASPSAITRTKASFLACEYDNATATDVASLSQGAAAQRLSSESAEGLHAFAEKRAPAWYSAQPTGS